MPGSHVHRITRSVHLWVEKLPGSSVVGDRVMQALPRRLSAQQVEFLLGSLMGDGALSPTRSGYGASFRYTHCAAQIAYADWKAELLWEHRAESLRA